MNSIFILFDSVFYFTIVCIIVLVYILTTVGIVLYLRECIVQKKILMFNIIMFKKFFSSKKLIVFLLFFLGFNYFMYNAQRSEWINKNTIHHNAKEYFVAYIPIAFYKKILNTIVEQDSIIMKPFNMMSEVLYEKGVKLLPINDGEKYYWKYRIFNYWYARGSGYMPNYNPYKPKPITKEQQEILDSMYEVAKGVATLQIQDKTVNREKYKVFIATTNYYIHKKFLPYNNFIINRMSDRAIAALKNRNFIEKEKKILSWTLQFQKEYKKNKYLTKEIEKDMPILGISYLIVINDLTEELIFKMIVEKKLDCNLEYIQIYLNNSEEILSKISPLYRLSESQQKIILDYIFNIYMSYFDRYMLQNECNLKIEFGYPSNDWIRDELSSIIDRWMSKNNSTNKYNISIDTNIENIITLPKGVIQ